MRRTEMDALGRALQHHVREGRLQSAQLHPDGKAWTIFFAPGTKPSALMCNPSVARGVALGLASAVHARDKRIGPTPGNFPESLDNDLNPGIE